MYAWWIHGVRKVPETTTSLDSSTAAARQSGGGRCRAHSRELFLLFVSSPLSRSRGSTPGRRRRRPPTTRARARPGSIASSTSTTAGSGSYSTLTSSTASVAAASVSATTSATGCPAKTTSERARGSVVRSEPVAVMGKSSATRTATTPGSARLVAVDAPNQRMRFRREDQPAVEEAVHVPVRREASRPGDLVGRVEPRARDAYDALRQRPPSCVCVRARALGRPPLRRHDGGTPPGRSDRRRSPRPLVPRSALRRRGAEKVARLRP